MPMTPPTPPTPPAPNTLWRSNATPEAIAERLGPLSRVVVTTHTKPDGDAIGSSLALVRTLRLLAEAREDDPGGIRAWYAGPLPHWLGALADRDEYAQIESGGLGEIDPEAIVITDTGSWKQLEGIADFLRPRTDLAVVIDHHLDGDAEVAPMRLIDMTSAAACVPVCAVCTHLLGLDDPAALPAEVAEPIYLGLATDTGWFHHPSVKPRVMRCAADMLSAGAQHTKLFELTEQDYSPGRIRLLARALGSMELLLDDALAILTITHDDLHHSGARPGETSGIADMVLTVGSVRVCAVLTQADDADGPKTKVSLRSKAGQQAINVNEVARHFGGGGHAGASGARTNLSLAQTRDRLVAILQSLV